MIFQFSAKLSPNFIPLKICKGPTVSKKNFPSRVRMAAPQWANIQHFSFFLIMRRVKFRFKPTRNKQARKIRRTKTKKKFIFKFI